MIQPLGREEAGGEAALHPQKPGSARSCGEAEDWPSASSRYYATGEVGRVEIDSEWKVRRRELACVRAEAAEDKVRFN